MENFETLLQQELAKLPYQKHVDDGMYNKGQVDGFELGARWSKDMLTDKNSFVVKLKATKKLKRGDVFLWQSALNGKFSIHTFHSDAGYGIKTYTDYNEKEGSSLLVNYSGFRGLIYRP